MQMPRCSSRVLSALLLPTLLISVAPVVVAQPKPVAAPVGASAAPPTDEELAATRGQLIDLLRMSPTLVQVVETDPTLLADQEYVSRSNPQLAQFLTQHPEVTRNPDFYLFANFPQARGGHYVQNLRRRVNGNNNDQMNDQELKRQYMQNVMMALTFVGIAGSLLWLIRLLLENRRWSRVFRLQSEIHARLIERFASNQELLHYMETEPGKRFLEAAPIPIDSPRDQRLPGGLARVLAPLQIGIVLTLLGLGLLILERSGRLYDIAGPLLVFGMVAMMPGIGFIISAIISWRISERLGLMPQPSASSNEPSDRQ
jgi:hypothetical protein